MLARGFMWITTLAPLLLIISKTTIQHESCPAMTLVLSQRNTIGFRIVMRNFIHLLLNKSLQAGMVLRLRRKGPQWARVALMVIVGDILLAAVAWMAVDFFLR